MRPAAAVPVAFLLLLIAGPATAQSAPPAAPDYLPDESGPSTGVHHFEPAHPSPFADPSYQGLLAAGYLLAIPSSFMTGGVGMLLPVGMHYYHDNPSGGVRALFGILGGLAVGGVAGGFIDQPEGGFEFTRGMLIGAASGFFTWGIIDVAFFAERERPDHRTDLSFSVDVNPGAGVAAVQVAGAL